VQDKSVNAREIVGEVFIYLAIDRLCTIHDYNWTNDARKTWMQALKWVGTGLIELEIERLYVSGGNNMCSLLDNIILYLREFDSFIPLSTIRDLSHGYLPFSEDFPTEPLLSFVSSVKDLLVCNSR
jgi:hypothetical protein